MHAVRRRRLIAIIIIAVGLSIAVGLALFALRKNINLFYTPSQVQAGVAPINHSFRIGGMVKKQSVRRDAKSLKVQFAITDYKANVIVIYYGILPDLFREEQGIVAEGKLDGAGHFIAHQVLAKHDENYMPPEVRATLINKKGNNA